MNGKPSHKTLRVGGVILGLAFLVVGAVSVHGALTMTGLDDPDRVFWYGVTTLIAGALSILFAAIEPKPEWVFCAPPRRPGHRLVGPAPEDTEQSSLFETRELGNPDQARRVPRM
jgi:hypothetical protein